MLARSIDKELLLWKQSSSRQAFLLTGARQVGKTYAVRKFAQENYERFLEINFAETPSACTIFEGDLDARTLISSITAYSSLPLIPNNTLIFFDEIQECPRARTAIKFLVDYGFYDYIESGSLLGVLSKDVPSLPVGYETLHRMYPLSFEEFLRALGIQPEVLEIVQACFLEQKAVPQAIHERLLHIFRLYVTCGGMPQAVQQLVDTNDLARVLQIQKDILALYRADVAKYAANKPHVYRIFDAIPGELDQENKRFKLSDLAKTARMERYENDFMWLIDAGVALPCYNVKTPQKPLLLNEQHNLFKLYLCDCGLLTAMFEDNIQYELLKGNVGINWGSVLENVVAQELASNDSKLYYYDRSKMGEIDFLIQTGNSVIPVEVKSGTDYMTHRALNKILDIDEWKLSQAYVLCSGNLEMRGKIAYIPWYMFIYLLHNDIDHLYVQW